MLQTPPLLWFSCVLQQEMADFAPVFLVAKVVQISRLQNLSLLKSMVSLHQRALLLLSSVSFVLVSKKLYGHHFSYLALLGSIN